MRPAILFLGLVAACQSGSASSARHRQPRRVVPAAPSRPARLPPGTRLAFAMDLRGVEVPGTWDVRGTVRSVAPGRIVFNSEGRAATFLYRLPGELSMRVAVGEEFRVRRRIRVFPGGQGYTVLVIAGGRLAVAAGRIGADKALGERFAGLALEQGAPDRVLLSSRYETMRAVPVTLRFSKGSVGLPVGRDHDFAVLKRKFSVHIPRSVYTRPVNLGVSEGRGYTLEYAVVRR